MPERWVLSTPCSATADRQAGCSSVLFELSGTARTTLSADPKWEFIGDEEPR
jgi:ATP-dependent phosphoenolpyruvate carboxykinase